MSLPRSLKSAVAGVACCLAPLGAQDVGDVRGRVAESTSNRPLPNVSVSVEGTRYRTISRSDGSYDLSSLPAGAHIVRAQRIGYELARRPVTVTAGSTVVADFTLLPRAPLLTEVVVTGYGAQRREAITGSVAKLDADVANVGTVTNATQLLQGRVSGVHMLQNSGEPGAGSQIRIRGGTSISAGNDPLYVIDGVPLQNEATTPLSAGGWAPALPRSPLNAINVNDIESLTVLKDASATAIYGSRAANGVILIQTKRGDPTRPTMEYETYLGASWPASTLALASADEYRDFVAKNQNLLGPDALAALGNANTDWQKELTRTGITHNHNLAFSGGSGQTQYRASLNYLDKKGVVIASGLRRYQGRLNATKDALDGRLRLALNLMTSRVHNEYAPTENGRGGSQHGVLTNMATYNPTYPVQRFDVTECCNPLAMATQIQDQAPETRLLGDLTGAITLSDGLTAQTSVGIDNSQSIRRMYMPRASEIGAGYDGFASQENLSLQNVSMQQLLTYTSRFGLNHELEIVGGYEHTKTDNRGFRAQTQGFITDVFGVDNLGAGTQALSPAPTSFRVESELASFFSRANYGFAGRYFLTGVIRYDGSSRLAEGHQWSLFPAISASWKVSRESFMSDQPFGISSLALRASWGRQGNQSVAPYQTKLLLRADPGAVYPIGNVLTTGFRAAQVGNPDLKWETAEQVNFGIDFGFLYERFTGVIDLYQKTTRDLLLEVEVPQPAVVSRRLENIGNVRNRGVEVTLKTALMRRGTRSLSLEVAAHAERNEVTSLGDTVRACNKDGWWQADPIPLCTFYNTGGVSGPGQSGQYSQRIMVGEAIGTFFAPVFLRVNRQGQQVFRCRPTRPECANGETTDPTDADRKVIGSANPWFSLGVSTNGTWGSLDASWLWRAEFGGKVFNNTSLALLSKTLAKQRRNFLRAALTIPDAIDEPAKYSSRWIEDRTFVRLQNVTVGYQVPSRFVEGHAARVYLSADNVLLITSYTGYDPEVFSGGGIGVRGIDYLVYPPTRTYTIGARVQF